MKTAAILIRDPDQQYEGLQTSLGLLLEDIRVMMIVLHHEIADMDEAYRENLDFFAELSGERYSNNSVNVEKYGFSHATLDQIAEMIGTVDRVIPF